ncbi:hypothetical protein [Sciscionella marina]|uniref:hypothetical protein n=1 Tax=Sciscionella marina TaxID=508770 RepID=UPI0003A22A07|nr:hypothetical protein [Sciscionella marina]
MQPDQLPILRVRLRKGIVEETRRTVHLVPVPDEVCERLVAYCGESFEPGTVDLLTSFTGMPCMSCLNALPQPTSAPLTPGV